MKKTFLLITIILLLTSCVPAAEVTQVVVTETSSPVPTKSLAVTSTPTAKPTPTATITPMVVSQVPVNPLALNEFNAGNEMKRLNIMGTGSPHVIKFAPDGSQLAIATGRGIYLYNSTTFEESSFIDVNESVSSIAFGPDGSTLAVAVDGKVSIWNVNSGEKLLDLEGGMIGVSELAYGLGGQVAAIGSDCRGCGTPVEVMILWDARTGNKIYEEHDIWYFTVAIEFTPDGRQLIFGGKDGLTIIEAATGKQTSQKPLKIGTPFDFIFGKNNERIFLVNAFDGSSQTFNLLTQEQSPFGVCSGYGAYLIRANQTGACLSDKSIILFDSLTGKTVRNMDIDVDSYIVGNLFALNPEGSILAYYDGSGVNITDTQTGASVNTLHVTDFDVIQAGTIEINELEKYVVATLSYPGRVDIFDIETGELFQTLQLDCCEITGFAFAPDHKTAATLQDRTINIWDLKSGEIIYEATLRGIFPGSIAFSPDGRKIYLTNQDGDVIEFDLQSRQTTKLGRNSYSYNYADPFAIDNFHFNSSGNLILFSYESDKEGYTLTFQDIATNEKIVLPYNVTSDFGSLETFSLSLDDNYLVLGKVDGIFVWEITSRKQLFHFDKHESRHGDGWSGTIKSLAFSPKSNLLVSVGWDGTTRLWSLQTGNELRLLNVCCSASFTLDGRYLVTAGEGVIQVWGIP